MAEGSPFREKSLERLSSPERLDQLLYVVDRKSWLPLATLAFLVAAVGVWAVVGKVPVHVQGKGVLVYPRDVVLLEAPALGYLSDVTVAVGDTVRAGQVVARIARPDVEKQLELARAKLDQLATQLRAGAATGGVASLAALKEIAERLRHEEREALADERARLEEQLRLARAVAGRAERDLAGRRRLNAEELLSGDDVLDAERAHEESQGRVVELESALRELGPRDLEADSRYLDRLARLTDREQLLADVEREVARLEHELDQESRIVAERAGVVLELTATRGSYLEPGDRVGAIGAPGAAASLVSLSYFTVRDGKRLDAEMEIQVTPDNVERARFGGIRGRIASVSSRPVTRAEVEAVVGNPELAESLVAGGYLMQVEARLESDPTSTSGFRWSSSSGPRRPVSPGTTTTARVAVEKRPPITFVLPYLRAAAGLD